LNRTFLKRKDIRWHFIMVVISIVYLAPFIYTFTNAFKPRTAVEIYPPSLFFDFTLKHFVDALKIYNLHKNIINSLKIALGATGLGLLCGTFSAYVISRYRQRWMKIFIIFTMVVPYMVCLLPLFLMFQRLNLINSIPGLILAHTFITVPQSVWILTGFIDGVPPELEYSAWIDGCSRVGSFFRIILPLIKPGLVATAVLSFMLSWNNFNIALVLAHSETMTAPYTIYHFVSFEMIDWGGFSAIVILLTIPTIFFVIATQKHLIRGFMGGYEK